MQSIILSVLSIGVYLFVDIRNVALANIADDILSITVNQQEQQKLPQDPKNNKQSIDMTVQVEPIDTNTGNPTVLSSWTPAVVSTSPRNVFTHIGSVVPAGNEYNHVAITSVVQSNNAEHSDGATGDSAGAAHNGPCLNWHRPYHHLYFQLSNTFLLLAFLAPHGLGGMLWLRIMLIVGAIFLGMYGYLIECASDVIIWSSMFLVINVFYLLVLFFRLRPVHFDREIESAYLALFKPLRVTRHQFKLLLSCMKTIRTLKYQDVYAQEKITKVDSLSLVLSGKLVVSQNQRALHIVFPHHFLDSPEWFGVSTDDYFQVSIMAMEQSRVLIWHRDKLKLSIMGEPFLQAVFDHILGRDVVKKLMQVTQVSESIASNGFLPTGNSLCEDDEDKSMLITKKTAEGHSLTALINRQLQEDHAPLLASSCTSSATSSLSPLTTSSSTTHILQNSNIISTARKHLKPSSNCNGYNATPRNTSDVEMNSD